jgi:hypothetical protein
MFNMGNMDVYEIEEENFNNMGITNVSLISNISDCSATIGQALASCGVIMALKAMVTIVAGQTFEGGEKRSCKSKMID